MPQIPKEIGSSERLGRRITDTKKAERAASGRIIPPVFKDRSGEISIDRLDYPDERALIPQLLATDKETGREIKGWAVVLAEDASKDGRETISSPLADNPFHGEILIPPEQFEDMEKRKEHFGDLAKASVWLVRPETK